MDAVKLLKSDHEKVKKMLEELDSTTERAEKTRTEGLAKLKDELVVHEAIEEEIFYPALKRFAEAKDIVLEAYEEHDVVDSIMADLEQTSVEDEKWHAKFTVMKENLEHHIEEEEGEMFKQARDVMDDSEDRQPGRGDGGPQGPAPSREGLTVGPSVPLGARRAAHVDARLGAWVVLGGPPLDNRYNDCHNAAMERTTVMADPEVLDRLRGLARERGVSFAEIVREAMADKAVEFRPKPKSLGLFSSGRGDGSSVAGDPQPPASWR